jgi:hypothetical protein
MPDVDEPLLPASERKCPLCRGGQTNFHDVYSDGDEIVKSPFRHQRCAKCDLPCKFWTDVERLIKENNRLEQLAADWGDKLDEWADVTGFYTATAVKDELERRKELLQRMVDGDETAKLEYIRTEAKP